MEIQLFNGDSVIPMGTPHGTTISGTLVQAMSNYSGMLSAAITRLKTHSLWLQIGSKERKKDNYPTHPYTIYNTTTMAVENTSNLQQRLMS